MEKNGWTHIAEGSVVRVREDDLSVQYGTAEYSSLYIRIERPPVPSQTISISECNVAEDDILLAVAAFQHVSLKRGIEFQGRKLRISNFVDHSDHKQVVKSFDVQKVMFARVCKNLGLSWSDFFLSNPHPGRFDIVIELA